MSYEDRKAQADALTEKLQPLLLKNILLNCDNCTIVNPTKPHKHCNNCFLLEEGLIEKVPFISASITKNPEEYENQKKIVEGIKERNLLIGSLAASSNYWFKGMRLVADRFLKESEEYQKESEARLVESKKLYEEKSVIDEKFKKLGRPSAFSKRYDLYCEHYLGVPNPPSYNQLAKIVGVSRQQVIRDLKRMGQYHKKLDKQ